MGSSSPGGAADRLLGLVVSCAIRLAAFAGIDTSCQVGAAIGRLWWTVGAPRSDRVLRQLAVAYPEKDTQWCQKTARAVFENLGRTVAEGLLLAGRQREALLDRVDVDGLERLEQARRDSPTGGVLIVSAHLGNWELAGAKLAALGLPVVAVHRPPPSAALNRALSWVRGAGTRTAVPSIPMGPRAGVPFVRALESGQILLTLLDQRASRKEGQVVPFFAQPAPTRTAPLKLAARVGAPVVVGLLRRLPESRRYAIEVVQNRAGSHASTPEEIAGHVERGVREITERLEIGIRKAPDQWIWTHRRWAERRD